jgi:hypothetical protein
VHPAYRDYLPQVASALSSVATELAGLPGVPTRATEVAQAALPPALADGNGNGQVTGGVYQFSMNNAVALQPDASQLKDGFQQDIVRAVVIGPASQDVTSTGPGGSPGDLRPDNGTLAQQAVEDGLLRALGSQPVPVVGVDGGPGAQQFRQQQSEVAAAAARFAALPAATRNAWLAVNLAAVKAGTTTLAQVP